MELRNLVLHIHRAEVAQDPTYEALQYSKLFYITTMAEGLSESKGFPIGVLRFYKRTLRVRSGVSFNTHTTEGTQEVLWEARDTKRPADPLCLVTYNGGELPPDFTILKHWAALNNIPPSRIVPPLKKEDENDRDMHENLDNSGQLDTTVVVDEEVQKNLLK
ncbi:hypothetical protein OS493_024059 [Desmophyllum pertusum]|uniref:Uncharacterized protein n=1 Tax=Desmophyllum pertusum TaxID=174260 RepID=A0A9X0D230_9CNID|nr:hypothetical protein OS493_024059 [Desmophyllum pertusum]